MYCESLLITDFFSPFLKIDNIIDGFLVFKFIIPLFIYSFITIQFYLRKLLKYSYDLLAAQLDKSDFLSIIEVFYI